jgi:hypothetical protein
LLPQKNDTTIDSSAAYRRNIQGQTVQEESTVGVECYYYLLPRPNTFRLTGEQVRRLVELLRSGGWVPPEPIQEREGTRLVGPAHVEEVSIEDGLRLIPPSGVPDRDLCFFRSFPQWDKTQSRFPFTVEPDPKQGFDYWYYDLELHLMAAGFFAHDCGETVDLIEDSRCSTCGQELDWTRIDVGWGGAARRLRPWETFGQRARAWLYRGLSREAPPARRHRVGDVVWTREPDVERGRAIYREYYGGFEGVGIAYSSIHALSRLRDHCPSCGQLFDPSTRIARAKDPMTFAPYTILGGITYHFALMINCGKSLPITLAADNRLQPELVDLCQRHFGTDFYEVGAYG